MRREDALNRKKEYESPVVHSIIVLSIYGLSAARLIYSIEIV